MIICSAANFGPPSTNMMSTRLPAAKATDSASPNACPKFTWSSWTDYFFDYSPEEDSGTRTQLEQEVTELKEQVRIKLKETIAHKSMLEQLQLIDDIERLGVGYHFEDEIEEALHKIYHTCFCLHHGSEQNFDLYHASLMFRPLRRHGYCVPCDIFKQFLDECGKFKASLCTDVDGMLSLYEASHLRIHGDAILDEALTFTSTQLKSMTNKLAHPLAAKVLHALRQPLHKGTARLEARYYISFYEHNPCHSKILLKFAKLDFNLLQSLHKKDLADLTRWCRDLDIYPRLPRNVREATVELYYCGLATFDERPQYSPARLMYAKSTIIWTIIDDLYDVCDISDIELLTEAIKRWDKGYAGVAQLPELLKLVYTKTLDVFEELEQLLAKEGRSHTFRYAVESFKAAWSCNLVTTKWSREGYIPTLEDYLMNSWPTIGTVFCSVIGCIGLGGDIATEEVFEWARQFPKIIEALCTIARLQDDIAEDDPKERAATEKPSAIACYMKQYNVTKDEAYKGLRNMIDDAWKDINQAMLRPTAMPMPVLERMLSQARMCETLYEDGDGFSCSYETPMKENLTLLFKDPIPM